MPTKVLKFILLFLFAIETNGAERDFFMRHPLDGMLILKKLPEERYGANAPIEQREEEFSKFLSVSVKVQVSGGSGSGSIIYYDAKKNLAYVASCGHLWSPGVVSAEDAEKKDNKCKIIVWYKNNKKLKEPEQFDAKMVFYCYNNDIDTSLLVFSPDWEPFYFPIAPIDYKYKINSLAHSCGCDGGREVAHYEVNILELNDDLVTTKNSPRPGRSGGGLFDENFYIGTCWGTEHVDGSGNGYFTPIKDIHRFWGKQKDYSFLLLIGTNVKGKLIPIVDKVHPQGTYNQDYILSP